MSVLFIAFQGRLGFCVDGGKSAAYTNQFDVWFGPFGICRWFGTHWNATVESKTAWWWKSSVAMGIVSASIGTEFPIIRSVNANIAARRGKVKFRISFLFQFHRKLLWLYLFQSFQIKDKLATHDSVVSQFNQLQEQYDAILQMYGEKVEETEELQLDLADVKDMYRSQIDDLLLQQRQLQQKLFEAQQKSSDASKWEISRQKFQKFVHSFCIKPSILGAKREKLSWQKTDKANNVQRT